MGRKGGYCNVGRKGDIVLREERGIMMEERGIMMEERGIL